MESSWSKCKLWVSGQLLNLATLRTAASAAFYPPRMSASLTCSKSVVSSVLPPSSCVALSLAACTRSKMAGAQSISD